MFKSINMKDFKNLLLDKSNKFLLIDVRTKEEWDKKHIKDRRVKNIELNELLKDTSVIPKDIPVYLLCESSQRSGYAQMILFTKGIKTINISGGMSQFIS